MRSTTVTLAVGTVVTAAVLAPAASAAAAPTELDCSGSLVVVADGRDYFGGWCR